MFVYEKKLQYPVKIKNTNPALAKFIISQYGGPDGELGASLRYLSQRYSMPSPELKGLLTDIGTEELGHLEMIGAIVHQLTRNMTPEQIKKAGYEAYFVDHTAGVYPTAASGAPWNAASPTTTSCACATTPTSATSSASCASGRSSTTSASARPCASPPRSSTRRTCTPSIPPSISDTRKKDAGISGVFFNFACYIPARAQTVA